MSEKGMPIPQARLVPSIHPGKVWVMVPHRDGSRDWIEADDLPASLDFDDSEGEEVRELVEAHAGHGECAVYVAATELLQVIDREVCKVNASVGPKIDHHPADLRDIAKRIEPAFPEAADELCKMAALIEGVQRWAS